MENFDQFIQMAEAFHPTPIAAPRPTLFAAQIEALNKDLEAHIKDIEALVLENDNLNRALLWDSAKTLQGTKFYDSFIAFLHEHLD